MPKNVLKAYTHDLRYFGAAVLMACLAGSCSPADDHSAISYFDTQPAIDYKKLRAGFQDVPQEAMMRTWWFWMSGMATKKSITRDLEAMKANGIAGAILCDNGGDTPRLE